MLKGAVTSTLSLRFGDVKSSLENPTRHSFNACGNDKNKMASVLFRIAGAMMNAFAFSGTIFFFSKPTDHGEKERKIHDLALEKLQRARDK